MDVDASITKQTRRELIQGIGFTLAAISAPAHESATANRLIVLAKPNNCVNGRSVISVQLPTNILKVFLFHNSPSQTGTMNYLSTHFVVRTSDVQKADASREFIAQAALALPVGVERQLRAMKRQIDGDPRSRDSVGIAFTEWLFTSPRGQAPMYDNLGGALCTAGMLNTLMRVADFTPSAPG